MNPNLLANLPAAIHPAILILLIVLISVILFTYREVHR